jgi:hypothetical protein
MEAPGVNLLGSYYVPKEWDSHHTTARSVIARQNWLVGATGARAHYQTGGSVGGKITVKSTRTNLPQESRVVKNHGQTGLAPDIQDLKLDPRLSNAVAMMTGGSPLDSNSDEPAEVLRKKRLAVLRDHVHSGPATKARGKTTRKRKPRVTAAYHVKGLIALGEQPAKKKRRTSKKGGRTFTSLVNTTLDL